MHNEKKTTNVNDFLDNFEVNVPQNYLMNTKSDEKKSKQTKKTKQVSNQQKDFDNYNIDINNKEIDRIDKIEIKEIKKTFEELLNEQLQQDSNAIPDEQILNSHKPLFEYKKKNRIDEKLIYSNKDISTGKYKYYAQRFDDGFGTPNEKQLVFEVPSYNKKLKSKKPVKSSTTQKKVPLKQNSVTESREFKEKIDDKKINQIKENKDIEITQKNTIKKEPIGINNNSLSKPTITGSNQKKDLSSTLAPNKGFQKKEEEDNLKFTFHQEIKQKSNFSNTQTQNAKIHINQEELIEKTKINLNNTKNTAKTPAFYEDEISALLAPIKRPKVVEEMMNNKNDDDFENCEEENDSNNDEFDYLKVENINNNNNYQENKNQSNNESNEIENEYDYENSNFNQPGDYYNKKYEEYSKKIYNNNDNEDEEMDEDDIILQKYNLGKKQIKQEPDEEVEEENIYKLQPQNYQELPKEQTIVKKYFKQNIQNSGIVQAKQNNNINKANAEVTSNKKPIQAPELNNLPLEVQEKINLLEKQIEELTNEKNKVQKIKNEYSRLTKELKDEEQKAAEARDKEMKEFVQWKEQETKKIQKEKQLHARNIKAMQEMPNRKEREEIENLNKEITRLKEEMKVKDSKTKINDNRLKKQIEELKQKNEELTKELKLMEELRIKQMAESGPLKKKVVKKENAPTQAPAVLQNQNNTSDIKFGRNESKSNIKDKSQNNIKVPYSNVSFENHSNNQINTPEIGKNQGNIVKNPINYNNNKYDIYANNNYTPNNEYEKNSDDDQENDQEKCQNDDENNDNDNYENNKFSQHNSHQVFMINKMKQANSNINNKNKITNQLNQNNNPTTINKNPNIKPLRSIFCCLISAEISASFFCCINWSFSFS